LSFGNNHHIRTNFPFGRYISPDLNELCSIIHRGARSEVLDNEEVRGIGRKARN